MTAPAVYTRRCASSASSLPHVLELSLVIQKIVGEEDKDILGGICSMNQTFETNTTATIKSALTNNNFLNNNGNIDEVRFSMTDVGTPTEEKLENETFNYVKNSCTVCNKQVTHMTKHMKTHIYNESMNEKCHICDKTFKLKKYLKQHMKSHNGKKLIMA